MKLPNFKTKTISFRNTLFSKKIIINYLALFTILIFSIVLSGKGSKYLILLDTFIKILFFQFFLFIPGFYFLKLLNKKYFNNNISILLSCSASILVFGLIFLVLQFFNSPPFVYLIINGGFIFTVISLAYKRRLLCEIFRINNIYKYGLLLVLIGSIITLCFVSVNTNIPKLDIVDGSNIATRGIFSLPVDNVIPYRTAIVFIENLDPWATHYWTMGDRPPLMGIVNSIWALSTLNKNNYVFWYYQIVGTVLNIIFILPCAAISKRIFKDPKVFYIVPVAILLNVFIFINIYYTWPKLMGSYFALISIALLLNKKIGYLSMSIVGILWGLGALSHGGAILSLPIMFVLCVVFLIKLKKIKFIIPFFAFLLLLQSPWIIYKKLHPAINTNHLIVHYIPTEKFPGKPIKTISHFFKEVPIEKQLEHRFKGLKDLIRENSIYTAFNSLLTGYLMIYYDGLNGREFFHPITAMGEFQILLCIPILLYFIIVYFLFKQKKILSNFNIKLISFFLSFIILSYIFNVFSKWYQQAINHALPYVELILAIMIVSGISFSLIKTIRIFSFILIIVRFIYYVISSSLYHEFQIFDFFNVAVIIGVAIMIYLSQYYVRSQVTSQ